MIIEITVFHYNTNYGKDGYVVKYENRSRSLVEGFNKIPKTVLDFLTSHDWHYSAEESMKTIPVYKVF